jgi:hypothetical protein
MLLDDAVALEARERRATDGDWSFGGRDPEERMLVVSGAVPADRGAVTVEE